MIAFEKYLIENGWETKDIGGYSSLGTVQKKYKKGDKEIFIGLSERYSGGVTVIYPRPHISKKQFVDDDAMNRVLLKYDNDSILDSLFDKDKVLEV